MSASVDTPGSRSAAIPAVSPTVVRLLFFIVYYAVNVIFVADAFSALLTFPMFALCCYNVSRLCKAYATVEDLLWLMIFIFFVVGPCQTLRSGHFAIDSPAGGIFFDDGEIIKAEAIAVLFAFVATVTSDLTRRLVPPAAAAHYQLVGHAFPILLVFNVLGFAMFVVFQEGIGNVLSARQSKEFVDETSATILSGVAISFQMIACLLTCVYAKCKPQRSLQGRLAVNASCVVALVLLLICQNPYNTARFFLLIAWLPIVLVFVSGKISIKYFYLIVISGLAVVMPMLNYTTRFGASLAKAAASVDLSNVLTIPGLDVFDMLLYEVRYLKSADFFWGAKTLGLMFFFIPRSIWTGKATVLAGDMGAKLADLGTAGTPNLSNFVAGDFYADLGMLGVAIGAVMVAFFLTFLGKKRPVLVHGMDLRAFVFMAAVPILVRGSLGGVAALTFLELIILAILTRVLCRRIRSRPGANILSSGDAATPAASMAR